MTIILKIPERSTITRVWWLIDFVPDFVLSLNVGRHVASHNVHILCRYPRVIATCNFARLGEFNHLHTNRRMIESDKVIYCYPVVIVKDQLPKVSRPKASVN